MTSGPLRPIVEPAVGAPASPALHGMPRDGAWRPFYRLVGLLFVVFPVATILSSQPDPGEVVLVVAGVVLFGFVMIRGTRLPEPGPDGTIAPFVPPTTAAGILRETGPATAAVLGLIVVSVSLTWVRPEAGWFAFFYYASVSASTIRVPRLAVGLMIAAGVAAAVSFVVARGNAADAFVQGLSVSVIGLTVFSAIAVRRTNRALVVARHELARLAVADERARISRDLHDTLGHDLSVIALKSELAGRLLPTDPARAGSEIADVERVARGALTAVRGTISGVRQPTLAGELAGARVALGAAGIDGRVEPAPDGLSGSSDAILGWAVREGVTNVVRHGRARSAAVRVETDAHGVAIEIVNDRAADSPPGADDIAVETASGDAGQRGSGTGLAGLRERVAAVGGDLEAGPLPGGGFRLRVRLPRDPSERPATSTAAAPAPTRAIP